MVERVGISESDLRRLLDLVDPSRCGESGEFVPDSLLRDMPGVLGCDEVTFQTCDPYLRQWGGVQAVAPRDHDLHLDSEGLSIYWAAFWEAFCHPQLSGDFSSVRRSSDRVPGTGPGPRWAALHEFEGGGSLSLAANVPLPPTGTADHRLLIWRHDGSDFTDRDVLLLRFLRPHVIELYRLQQAASAPSGAPRLTPRQWEILRLVATGRTNLQIAHLLVVSEATVRKHLENIYERLEVNSRTEALAKAMPNQ
jgi:DNA-binding CsgD family transcriptional regulator